MNENQYKIDIGYANGIIVLNPNYLQGSITI